MNKLFKWISRIFFSPALFKQLSLKVKHYREIKLTRRLLAIWNGTAFPKWLSIAGPTIKPSRYKHPSFRYNDYAQFHLSYRQWKLLQRCIMHRQTIHLGFLRCHKPVKLLISKPVKKKLMEYPSMPISSTDADLLDQKSFPKVSC